MHRNIGSREFIKGSAIDSGLLVECKIQGFGLIVFVHRLSNSYKESQIDTVLASSVHSCDAQFNPIQNENLGKTRHFHETIAISGQIGEDCKNPSCLVEILLDWSELVLMAKY